MKNLKTKYHSIGIMLTSMLHVMTRNFKPKYHGIIYQCIGILFAGIIHGFIIYSTSHTVPFGNRDIPSLQMRNYFDKRQEFIPYFPNGTVLQPQPLQCSQIQWHNYASVHVVYDVYFNVSNTLNWLDDCRYRMTNKMKQSKVMQFMTNAAYVSDFTKDTSVVRIADQCITVAKELLQIQDCISV